MSGIIMIKYKLKYKTIRWKFIRECGVVYDIQCDQHHIGETARTYIVSISEHKLNSVL